MLDNKFKNMYIPASSDFGYAFVFCLFYYQEKIYLIRFLIFACIK